MDVNDYDSTRSWLGTFVPDCRVQQYLGVVNLDVVQFSSQHDERYLVDRWGLPREGEVTEIALLGEDKSVRRFASDDHMKDYLDSLLFDVCQVDLKNAQSLIRFVEKHGSFTARSSRNQEFYQDSPDENLDTWSLVDSVSPLAEGSVRSIEPVWHLARVLSQLRLASEVFDDLRKGTLGRIKAAARIELPAPGTSEWPVELAPTWLPSDIRTALRECPWVPRISVPFEPSRAKHYVAIGWLYLQRVLEKALWNSVGLHVLPRIPQSVLASIENVSGRQRYLNSTRAVSYADSRNVKPPMFGVRYRVWSKEQMLYIRLLDRGMHGGVQMVCALCGEYFAPPSGHFRYCSRHNDAEKKRFRRMQTAARLQDGR